jgi:hypothetical protein
MRIGTLQITTSKISFRLPAIIVLAVIVAAATVGAFSYNKASDEVNRQAITAYIENL